jgi:hypothetical protein
LRAWGTSGQRNIPRAHWSAWVACRASELLMKMGANCGEKRAHHGQVKPGASVEAPPISCHLKTLHAAP